MSGFMPRLGDIIEGGATYRIEEDVDTKSFTLSRATLEAGYQVGFILVDDRKAGVSSWATTKSTDALGHLISACAERFKAICGYVGFWKDSDGVFHIDPSEHYLGRDYAVHYGIIYGQLSIWDWAKMDDITITLADLVEGVE